MIITDENQKTTIRDAFQHWMDNTCVRFSELATNAPFDDQHILMTSYNNGFVRTIFSTIALFQKPLIRNKESLDKL